MRKQGKFLLFENSQEFSTWLTSATVRRRVILVQQHHTWIPNRSTFKGDNHFALLQAMENAHLERGFAEIAQNLTTFPDGRVALCRDLDKIPAGIKGANTGGICIENVGNFDAGGDVMSDEQRKLIIDLTAILCRRFSLEPSADTIVYHHWYDLNTGERTNGTGTTKTCPGTAFFGGNKVQDAEANLIPAVRAAWLSMPVAGAPPATPQGVCIITADVLNVRQAPDASARIVKRLTRGVHVNIYGTSSNWSRIDPVQEEWVSSRYLQPVL